MIIVSAIGCTVIIIALLWASAILRQRRRNEMRMRKIQANLDRTSHQNRET